MTASKYTVIGYDQNDPSLPLFKVFDRQLPSGKVLTAKEVQDSVAERLAAQRPHIIYTVVPTEDLWW